MPSIDNKTSHSAIKADHSLSRDGSNSQRSVRIRKFVRSISRGSNISGKHSNLSHDHVLRNQNNDMA